MRKEGIEKEAEKYLREYSWPGNIRQLKQQIEKSVIFAESDILKLEDLKAGNQDLNFGSAGAFLSQDEKTLISEALSKSGRNISKAAKLLNMSRPTLYSKMNKYNL